MKIDPEVAALLDDLPSTKLPEVLVEKGWGVQPMRHALEEGRGTLQHVTAPDQMAPTFEPCWQCGKPVANMRGQVADHAGSADCDAAIIDESDRLAWGHAPESSVEKIRKEQGLMEELHREFQARIAARDATRQEIQARRAKAKLAPCASSKHSHGCAHQCSQKGEHFGFHECKFCKHLWS